MSYAIIETGGKQLRVEPGRFYDVDLLPVNKGYQISLDNVLLVQHDGDVHIGQPLVEGALVEGTVMGHLRGKKIIVYKMRPKKKTRKKKGHRQELTRLMIDSISINGKVLAAEAKPLAEKPDTTATEVSSEATETVVETLPEAIEVEAPVEAESPAEIPEITSAVVTPEVEETRENVGERTQETTVEVETVTEEKPGEQAE